MCKDVIGKKSEDEKPRKLSECLKNEDFEIVVILEGNIETTGASCHIRTSYLPQEILFGYRFKPIYPKFTDFEYLFDYSQFDQVEEFQKELLYLNVAYNNRQWNCIYDARHEDKNYLLTYQNTVKKPSDEEKSNHLLNNLFNGFKNHITNNSELNLKSKNSRNQKDFNYNFDDAKKNIKKKNIEDINCDLFANHSPYQTLTNHAFNNNYENNLQTMNTVSTLMADTRNNSQFDLNTQNKEEIKCDRKANLAVKLNQLNNSLNKNKFKEELSDLGKSGRFTIVPVDNQLSQTDNQPKEEKNSILKSDKNVLKDKEITCKKNDEVLKINRSKQSPVRLSKQVLFRSHLSSRANTLTHSRDSDLDLCVYHQRANSLPPIHTCNEADLLKASRSSVNINGKSILVNRNHSPSNEDEGYITSNKNSKNDINSNC